MGWGDGEVGREEWEESATLVNKCHRGEIHDFSLRKLDGEGGRKAGKGAKTERRDYHKVTINTYDESGVTLTTKKRLPSSAQTVAHCTEGSRTKELGTNKTKKCTTNTFDHCPVVQ